MRGRVHARRTLKSLVADLRKYINFIEKVDRKGRNVVILVYRICEIVYIFCLCVDFINTYFELYGYNVSFVKEYVSSYCCFIRFMYSS